VVDLGDTLTMGIARSRCVSGGEGFCRDRYRHVGEDSCTIGGLRDWEDGSMRCFGELGIRSLEGEFGSLTWRQRRAGRGIVIDRVSCLFSRGGGSSLVLCATSR